MIEPLGASSPGRHAGPALDLQVHQALGRKGQHLTHKVGISTLLDQLKKVHSVVGHRRLPVRFKLRNSNPNRRPAVTAPGVRCAREASRTPSAEPSYTTTRDISAISPGHNPCGKALRS